MTDARQNKALSVRWEEMGRALDELGLAMSGYRSLTVEVVGLSIRPPAGAGGDFLLTVRGVDEAGARVVAFHGSPDLGDALRGLHNRIMNGSLKWRPDAFR
jgi:hypothetical protein